MIGKYKPMLDKEPSFAVLDHWSQKAELEINRGHHHEAVNTLKEVSGPLLSRGFSEELVRVGKKLLNELDWPEACVSFRAFDSLLRRLIESLTQLGQFQESKAYLSRYANAIPGKGAQFINYCDLQCNLHWFQGDFATAIYWGEQGESLRITSNVDTEFSTAHNLALARRDSGKIDIALEFFLSGLTIEQVLDPAVLERERRGSFYGNIGRCLQFQGRLNEALAAYRKCALILEEEQNESAILNRGYIRLWIGEGLRDLGDLRTAAAFVRSAISKWQAVSPPRARLAEKTVEALGAQTLGSLDPYSLDEVTIERTVREWIRK
jgi:tetratricopeptide (TPR) repeat protein